MTLPNVISFLYSDSVSLGGWCWTYLCSSTVALVFEISEVTTSCVYGKCNAAWCCRVRAFPSTSCIGSSPIHMLIKMLHAEGLPSWYVLEEAISPPQRWQGAWSWAVWSYCGFSLSLPPCFLSAFLRGVYVRVWISGGETTRSGLPHDLGAIYIPAKWAGGWADASWLESRDMKGHSHHQAGWLQDVVLLQIALCLEAHPVELEKKKSH